MLVSSSIPNLINGISQQPEILRLPTQADVQVNALSSVVEGLRKRPPTNFEFVAAEKGAQLTQNPATLLSHQINRDTSERYQVLLSDTSICVFNLRSKEQVQVKFSNGARDYLACKSPVRDLRALTVGDYTFVLNRTKVSRSLPELIPNYKPEALVWVRQGAYGSSYTVTVDGEAVTFRTPGRAQSAQEKTDGKKWVNDDGSYATAPTGYNAAPPRELVTDLTANYASTDYIGAKLFNLLKSNPKLASKFAFSRNGSLIKVNRLGVTTSAGTTYADFTLSVTDSQGDTVLRAFKDKVQNFSELPARCFSNFRLKVLGDAATRFDDYYVRYEGDKSGGTWIEDIADGIRYQLDPETMPHALTRQADGTFLFGPLPWGDRKAGDAVSNPLPSFLDKRIRDIFFFRDRMGFITQENVVMSRYGKYFELFKASATQTLDTDPIDVTVSHSKVSDLNHALAFNETLILFAQETQFQIAPVDLLTPKTVGFNQTTEFNCDPDCKPVGMGSFLYFTHDKGAYGSVKEYLVDSESATKDATDITAHVPKFLRAGLNQMAACSNENILIALPNAYRNRMWTCTGFVPVF